MAILTPRTVFRRKVVEGVPSSGDHKPNKDEIIQLLERMEDNSGAVVSRRTLALLNAVTPEAGTFPRGEVLNDPTPTNNGWYTWDGDSWALDREWPDTIARLTISGGTANAILATAQPGVNPASVLAFFINKPDANTGPLTISINGGVFVPVKNVNGDDFANGEGTGRLFLSNEGDHLRALNDANAAASAAQSASEAQTWAEAAEATAIPPGSIDAPKLAPSVRNKLSLFAADRTALAALPVDEAPVAYLTEGLRSGEFLRVELASLSTADQALAAADNADQQGVYVISTADPDYVWRRVYASGYVMAEWFGAEPWVIGETQDSTVAFQAAANFCQRYDDNADRVYGMGSWRWRGRHRLTSTVYIPFCQTFGSFGYQSSIALALMANPANWTGVNTGTDSVDNAVFYDASSGAAFECGQGAVPDNFTIYGRGFVNNGINVNLPQAESEFFDVSAFRYGKYIRPRNVVITLVRRAFDSVSTGEGGNNNGNYYSYHQNCEILRVHTAFRAGSTATYNTKLENCKILAARFGDFGVSVHNFVVVGGSFENFKEHTTIRARSELSFIGTYLETFEPSSIPLLFRLNNEQAGISFENCLIYMNNLVSLVSSVSLTNVRIKSLCNRFRLGPDASDAAAAHTIYALGSATNKLGMMAGDVIDKDSGNTKTTGYLSGSTTGLGLYSAATTI